MIDKDQVFIHSNQTENKFNARLCICDPM